MQEQTLISNTTPQDLVDTILTGVQALIKDSVKPQPQTEYLTRDEVCQLLKMNKSTLWAHTRKGKLQSYGIGARIYYKRDEVVNSVKPLKY